MRCLRNDQGQDMPPCVNSVGAYIQTHLNLDQGDPMKSLFFLSCFLFFVAPAWSAGMHDASGHSAQTGKFDPTAMSVALSTDPVTIEPGQPVHLSLRLTDGHGALVSDLKVVHEKKLHLIMVRDGLDVFAHVHPESEGEGLFGVTVIFPAPGTYLLYADFTSEGGQVATIRSELRVEGAPPAAPALEAHVPGRIQTSELLADIGVQKMQNMHRVSFSLMDLNGAPISDLEPYLGAMGHLVIIAANGFDYVHAHPLGAGQANEVAFEVHFPAPGLYKGWGQFQRAGQVMNVPFVVRIGSE